jgi:hypothetical protein
MREIMRFGWCLIVIAMVAAGCGKEPESAPPTQMKPTTPPTIAATDYAADHRRNCNGIRCDFHRRS